MNTSEPKPNECAIWKSTSQSGKDYLSVRATIDGVVHKFACFPNDYKDTDMKPDFKSAKPRDGGSTQREVPAMTKVVPGSKIVPQTVVVDDELPF